MKKSEAAACAPLTLALFLGGCVETKRPAVESANQYVGFAPSGSAGVSTNYQFDLGKRVEAKACAEPNTRYDAAIAGMSGAPTPGELAAAQAALAKLGDADLLLVIQSRGSVKDGKACGELVGRGITLRTIDGESPRAEQRPANAEAK